ncbi:MAG: GNAT family N-acetyltransferase [Dehalococcoidales bacterium]|nr:MAG: GNAT family N-acetyltransferase [Dehalococcoidales bacterium]
MAETAKFPRLETDRLVLRELTDEDTDVMFPHYSDEEVWTYLDTYPVEDPKEILEVINWGKYMLNNETGILWGLFSKEDGSFIGEMNYAGRRDATIEGKIHRAEIGYNMVRKCWGKGLAAEALREIIRYIFETTEIYRLEAIIDPANTRSRNLASRLGFQEEGTLRDYILWDGKYRDMVMYSLLKKEWQG